MTAEWRDYQEEAAEFFRSLGLEATTNATIQGVRTSHDIDVLVKSRHAGFEITWIIECKHWTTRISKLHVLGLRAIVADTGADRGILLAESGFQSGAAEAAVLTNVHLSSLSAARREASAEVFNMRLTELYDRLEKCRERYWDIPKGVRVEHGLRPDTGEGGYSGAAVVSLAEDILRKAFRGNYPFEADYMWKHAIRSMPKILYTLEETITLLEPIIQELESKLNACTTVIESAGN